MKYHLFKKLAALGMAASVSLSAITPAFAANDSSEEFVAEAENPDSDTETETPPDDEQAPSNEDTTPVDGDNEDSSNKDDGEQAPPSNEETSSKDEGEQTSPPNENNSKDEQTPSNEDTSNDEQTTPNEDTSNDEQTTSNENISNDEQAPPSNEDTSNDGEQPPSNEDTSNDEQMPSNENTSNDEQTPSNENLSKDDQTPSNENTSNDEQTPPSNENTLEEEKTSETPTVKPDGYGEVTQAGGKGDSLVTLEIVNDGSGGGDNKDPDNPGGGGDNKDPDNPGGGGDKEDPDNPGGGGDNKDPEPMIFSAYVPSKLPMKLTQDGTVLTPSNAAIINGVATKGIAVKDIEAHLDYDWAPEDWDADYANMEVNTKNVGLKLRGDTLSKDGDFSVNAEDWKIPKDSYIDLNMEAKLPPQKIETATQNSDVAVLSFTLDWSGDDTTTGPKWEGGTINPDKPDDTSSKPKIESTDTIIKGGTGSIKVTWDAKGDTVTLTSVTSSNTDVASIGDSTGSNGNKTVTLNGLKSGTSTITATLSNGETATLEVTVYEVGNPDDIKVTVSNKDFNVGDSITSDDVTASVPLVAPDGSTKTITVKPSVDTNTLQAGNNSLTGIVTVGGQDYPIHFDVTVENPDSNKSGIQAESNDTLIAGETGNVVFTWDTHQMTIRLDGVTSSDESIATVGTTTGVDGEKTVTIHALKGGTATITATLDNGETATFEAKVYTVGDAKDIQVTVNNQDLGIGDKVTSNDITVKVPIISPDGETKFIERTPSIEDNTLQAGDNTITGTVTVGKATYNITVTLTVEQSSIPISVTSTTYIVGNESNPINFQWDTKDGSITLSNVTSSNAEVATIKTTTGEEGNKTVDLDCLKAGTTNIELTFSNGSTASCEITVYEVGNLDDAEVVIADKEFNAGDTLSSDDVTIKVPLVDGEGNIKMVDMSVNFEDTTLKAGTNNFTVNLTVGGQTHPINFSITTEIPENMKSNIKAESNDTLVAGGTGNVAFTWDTRDNTISLTSVTSSNTDVVSIGTTTGSEGSKTTVLNALKGGTSTITATLSNGETATFEATVYEMGNPDDIQTTVNNKDLSAGDKVTPNDVTVKVPLIAPDGSTKLIEVTPSIEDKALTAGNNTLICTIVVGENTYNITISIEIAKTENPSNGLVMSVPDAQAMGFTFASYQDGLEITGFENKQFKSVINVPEQIGDFQVLRIGDNGFKDQSNLKEITIPDSVIEIGANSFEGCNNIVSLEFNGKLKKIGPRAFLNCSNLENVVLNTDSDFDMKIVNEKARINGNSNISTYFKISPFIGCSSLNSVYIKGDAKSLPPLFTVYIDSVSLTVSGYANVPLSETNSGTDIYNEKYFMERINSDIFIECNKLNETGRFAFHNTNMEKVHLLSNLEIISEGTFKSCTGTKFNIPNGVHTIGAGAFSKCSSLTNIAIPNSVTSIHNGAFQYCNNLVTVNMSDNVSSIGKYAFERTAITEFNIPSKITTIATATFRDCSKLTKINIPTTVTKLEDEVFSGCKLLDNVTIPSNVTYIPQKAFFNCNSLTKINIPNNITSISAYAFANCSNLQSISLSSKLTFIGSYAFNGTSNLKTININRKASAISGAPWGAPNATVNWTGTN